MCEIHLLGRGLHPRPVGESIHSQLMKRIKQMFVADASEEGFYQLNHNNQL